MNQQENGNVTTCASSWNTDHDDEAIWSKGSQEDDKTAQSLEEERNNQQNPNHSNGCHKEEMLTWPADDTQTQIVSSLARSLGEVQTRQYNLRG
jgi:hypothetical protein